jgi:hypothetical protein
MPDHSGDPAAAALEHDPAPGVGLAGAIREQVQRYAANRKQDAVRAVSDVAAGIHEAGAAFTDAPRLKAFFDNAAEGVEELSGDIGRRTVGELYDEVEAAVRRRPGVALAAAALAGFALLRFLKASALRPVPRSHAVVPVDVLPVPDIGGRP